MATIPNAPEYKPEDFESLFADRSVSGVLLDRNGMIVYANEGWKRFAEEAGLQLPNYGIGQNYLRFCAFADEQSARIIDGIAQLLAGRLDCMSYIYPCPLGSDRCWFVLLGFSHVKDELTALLHINITGLMPKGAQSINPAILADRFGPRPAAAPSERPLNAGAGEARAATLTAGELAESDSPAGSYSVRAASSVPMLSKRQKQVLELMAKGMSNVEIGRALSISPNTVKIHVSGILARLGLPSRAQAIHWTLTRNRPNQH
jgi:DNA-binding CsgD family transcriptional regulator